MDTLTLFFHFYLNKKTLHSRHLGGTVTILENTSILSFGLFGKASFMTFALFVRLNDSQDLKLVNEKNKKTSRTFPGVFPCSFKSDLCHCALHVPHPCLRGERHKKVSLFLSPSLLDYIVQVHRQLLSRMSSDGGSALVWSSSVTKEDQR